MTGALDGGDQADRFFQMIRLGTTYVDSGLRRNDVRGISLYFPFYEDSPALSF